MTKRIVLLQALSSTPNDLRLLTKGTPEGAVAWREDETTWSLLDVASHLALVERAYLARLERVVNEDEPHIPYIHPNEAEHNRERPLAESLAEFASAREETLRFLENLSPGMWQRAAIHETTGRLTLRYLVQDLVSHDIDHTNQVAAILSRWQAAGKTAGQAAGRAA